MENQQARDFLSFIKKEHLEEHVKEYIDQLNQSDIPLLKRFSHLSPEQLYGLIREGQVKFLTNFEKGTEMEEANLSFKKWEEDKLEGIPKQAIQPADLVLIYKAQKNSLFKFLTHYTDKPEEVVKIVLQLEDYYSEVQNQAVQLLFKMEKEVEEKLKAQELQLKVQNTLLKKTQQLAQIGSYELDLVTGKVFQSEEMNRIMERPHNPALDFNPAMPAIDPDDKPEVDKAVNKAIAEKSSFDIYYKIKTDAGNTKIVEGRGEVITNDKGEPVKIIGTVQDLTKIKTIKRELEKRNEQLKAAQKISKLGSCEYDRKTNTFTCTQEMEDIFEESAENLHEFDSDYLVSIVHPQDREVLKDHLEQAMQNNTSFELFHRILTHKGTERKVHTIGTVLFDEIRKENKLILTIQDITTLESLKELNLLKDQFIGIASHELKNPLTSISGYIQIMEMIIEKEDNGQLKYLVSRVSRQISRLKRLIDSMLDLNMIETGNIHYDMQAVEFCKLLDDWKKDFTVIHSDVKLEVESTVNCTVTGDRYRLEQVLNNLASNAIKYSPDTKEIKVAVRDKGTVLRIDVEDKGIGIGEEDKEKLFKKFSRIEQGSAKFSGLGLGLYITRQIVEKHGGEISVESKPGKGSVFSFTIPKAMAA